MKAQTIKLQIEDVDYEILVNVGTMIKAEEISGMTFMELSKLAEKGSVIAIAQLLSVCLQKDGKEVGFDFVSNMEYSMFDELFEPLIDGIINAFPKKDDKKKVVVLSKVMK